jgi:hypothetical protein
MKNITNYLKKILLVLGLFSMANANAQKIMDVDTFRTEFNNYSNDMRVVMISDPSCGGCMFMINQEVSVFEDSLGCGLRPDIKYFFIWTKVLGGSTLGHATTNQTTYNDSRYIHYWDEFQYLGDRYLNTLSLVDPSGSSGFYTAWHTVMCYAPGVSWSTSNVNPPYPNFWMHKLSTAYNADQNLYYTDSLFSIGFNNIACALSVDELNHDDKLSIYPNPSKSDITISYSALHDSGHFIISDILGNTIQKIKVPIGEGKIKISDKLIPGVYFCTFMEGNKKHETKKFMIIE